MTRSPRTLVHRVAATAAILPVVAAISLSTPAAHAADPSVAPAAVGATTVYSPQGLRAGITAKITNSSRSTAAARNAAVSLVGPGGTYSLGTIAVPRIAAGSTTTVRTTKVPPAATRIGTYRLRVCLAPTTSNCATSASIVSVKPHLSVSLTAIDFGTRAVGSFTSRIVTVVSDGRGAAEPAVALSGSDFGLDHTCGGPGGESRAPALAVGETCEVLVSYVPQEVGTDTGRLTVSGGTPGPAATRLSGTARIGADFSVPQESIDFGDVVVGQSSAREFVVTNDGDARAFVDFSPVDNEFVLSGCAASVGPGGSCSVTVTWTPASPGQRSTGVEVTDDGRPASRDYIGFVGRAIPGGTA